MRILGLLLLAMWVGCARWGFSPRSGELSDAARPDANPGDAAPGDGAQADAAVDAGGDASAGSSNPILVPGDDANCVIIDHTAWCWGAVVGPRQVPLSNVEAGAVGYRVNEDGGLDAHVCFAAGPSREVHCAGTNTDGELGTDPGPARTTFAPVPGLDGVVAVAAGSGFTCAQTLSAVFCWGRNHRGQLGHGTKGDPEGPAKVAGLPTPLRQITAGLDHACALAGTPASVYCWGSNREGQLGLALASLESLTPAEIAALRGATSVSAAVHYTCAIDAASQARCWGDNADDHLGQGSPGGEFWEPRLVTVLGGAPVTFLSAGRTFACASGPALDLVCWGQDDQGQRSQRPPALASWRGPIEVGGWHACVPSGPREVWCWGGNWVGQTGGPSTDNAPTRTLLTF